MKKLFFSLLFCILAPGPMDVNGQSFPAHQIFTVTNSSEVNILPGTVFFADSLILTPSAAFKISNASLTRNSAVVNQTGNPYISKVFKFSNATNPFSGVVQINYADNLLNGIAESNLNLMANNGSSWQLYPGGTNDPNNNSLISPAFMSVALNEVTLGRCVAPAAPVITSITQPTCSTATGSVSFSGLPGSGLWFLSGSTSAASVMITGTGTTGTFSDLTPGAYTFSVSKDGACISNPSNTATIYSQQQLTQNKKLIVSVFLEGVYDGTSSTMNTILNDHSLIPKSQPYNVPPWSYSGVESVAAIPQGVVDWVLVELRQAASPAAALSVTKLAGWPKAFFLKSDGTIVDLDGFSYPLVGNPSSPPNLYVIVRHRNHIAIMSSEGMTATCDSYIYNFTDLVTKAYGGTSGYKLIKNGVFGMVSGDTNSNGDISVLDFTKWATDFGKSNFYLTSDINGDAQVSVLDFTKWATNFGQTNITPVKSLNIGRGESQPAVIYKSQVPGN